MKNLKRIVLISTFLLSVSLCVEPYSLTMYTQSDCKHCRYMQSMLEKVLKEPKINGLVKLDVVHCETSPSECRDTFNPPLIEMRRIKENKKLG